MVTLRKIIHNGDERISLTFAFDSCIIKQIKQIEGSSWFPQGKYWHIPYTKKAYKQFVQLNIPFKIDDAGNTSKSLHNSDNNGIAIQQEALSAGPSIETNTQDADIHQQGDNGIIVRWNNNRFYITMAYIKRDVDFIKSLSGSWWNSKYKQWVVRSTVENLEQLNQHFACFDGKTFSKLYELIMKNQSPVILELFKSPEYPEHVFLRLKGYRADVAFIKTIPYRTYNPDLKRWRIPCDKELTDRIIAHYKSAGATIVNRLPKEEKSYYREREKMRDWIKTVLKKIPVAQKEVLSKFIDMMVRQRYSRKTIKSYVGKLSSLMNFHGGKPLTELTADDANTYLLYLAKEGLSESLQNMVFSAIKLYYEKVEYVSEFDLSRMRRPRKGSYLPSILSRGEVERMLASTNNLKHLSILYLLYGGGLRRAELIGMRVQDVLWERNQILIKGGKGKKDRMVMLSQMLKELLARYFDEYQPEYWLFEGRTSRQQYSGSSVRSIVKKAAHQAGIKRRVTPHTLRHCFATHLMDGGLDSRYIQELLGHKDIKTTLIYTHVTNRSMNNITSPLDQLRLQQKN